MARAMRKTTLREIKHTLGRYMAILSIIALGVGFFAGVRDTTPAMVNMMNGFFDDCNFYDYRIISDVGWSDESVAELSQQEDVLCAEGSISLDALFSTSVDSGEGKVLRTHMMPEKINTLKLVEGIMPTASDECAAEANKGIELGDTLTLLDTNSTETLEIFSKRQFTVTALVQSPLYINREKGNTSIGNGTVVSFIYLDKSAFDVDYFSEVYISFANDDMIYSEEYNSFIEGKNDVWEQNSEQIAAKHYNSLAAEAEEKLESARNELEANRTDGQAKLDAVAEEINAAKNQLAETKAQLDVAKSDLDMLEAYSGGNSAEFAQAKSEYSAGVTQYESAVADLEKGEADYNNSVKEFNKKIADAQAELEAAEKKAAALKKPTVYLLDRNTNIGYALFENDSEIVEQVARVFPIFFILVAALVCMTTMSRMVEEQRTQIGVLKAIGYSEAAIMGKFAFYSCSAALIGCVVGFALGTWLFPEIIWITYKLMYIPLDMTYYFDSRLAMAAVAASLVCSLGTTWISCRVELKEPAASLMRPKSPKAGKRVLPEYIPFFWNRLKFLHKVSVRNIFRYKGRFFMMVLGIGGCMTLLLTGFGLKDSIAGFADTQYNEILVADAAVTFSSGKADKVAAALDRESDGYVMLGHSSWDLLYGSRVKSIDLEAVENYADFSRFMVFRNMEGAPISPPKLNEALVSHSISERYNVDEGDKITLRSADMRELHLTVTGVFENHTYNLIYIDSATCVEQLGEVAINKAFVNFREGDSHSVQSVAINKCDGVLSVEQFDSTRERMAEMMSSLDYIVILVIACAAALAFIVIYNLTNINITERQREIATIKVLGFYCRETSAYVLRENITLTLIGIVVGIALGIPLHSFVMSQIKVDIVDFSTVIFPQSFVYSAALTLIFNFIVNIFMEIKLERINMADSLKSVD